MTFVSATAARVAAWPLQRLQLPGSDIVCSHHETSVAVSGKSAVVSHADRQALSVWSIYSSQVHSTFHSSPVHLEGDGTVFAFCRNF